MTKEEIQDLVEEVCDYDYSLECYEAERFNFDGKEGNFARFLNEFTKDLGVGLNAFDSSRMHGLAFILLANINKANLKWSKVWNNLDLNIYKYYGYEFVVEYIVKNINSMAFRNKIFKCKDIELSLKYHELFGKSHNYTKEEIEVEYLEYLDEYYKKNKKESPEKKLTDIIHSSNYNEELIYMLMQKSNLYSKYEDRYGWTTLGEELANKAVTFKMSEQIINTLLRKMKDNCFIDTRDKITDRCQLNFVAGNKKEARKIFKSDDYQLNSPMQYEALKNKGYYDIEELGNPKDHLIRLLLSVELSDAIDILYSKKIKMLDAEYLYTIKSIIGDNEYNKFMDHVANSDIIIYYNYADEKIMVSDNLRETMAYLEYKRHLRRMKTKQKVLKKLNENGVTHETK